MTDVEMADAPSATKKEVATKKFEVKKVGFLETLER